MAVTRKGRSLIMTAASDAYQFPIKVRSVRLIGTGMTAGQRLVMKEVDTNGAVITDHYVIAANEDALVWDGNDGVGGWMRRPFLDAVPAGGTWTLLFQLD